MTSFQVKSGEKQSFFKGKFEVCWLSYPCLALRASCCAPCRGRHWQDKALIFRKNITLCIKWLIRDLCVCVISVSIGTTNLKLNNSATQIQASRDLHWSQWILSFRGRGERLLIITGPLFTVICNWTSTSNCCRISQIYTFITNMNGKILTTFRW